MSTPTIPLLPQHQALLRASAITDAVRDERRYFSATTIPDLKRFGFTEAQCCLPALGLPIWGVDGQICLYQARPDTPRIDPKSGKPIKYTSLKRSRMALDVPPRARPFLGDPTTPLYITEGVRKADSAVSNGIDCCLALLGVWNWRGTNEDGGKVALPDWESIALNDREVYVAFDSDVMTKGEVRGALSRLSNFLRSRGARVRLIILPPGPGEAKVGLDDFFACGGTVANLLTLAVDAPPERAVPSIPPFPLDVFPPTVRRYLAGSAEAQGVPPDLVAVPFLAMVGGTIGNTRALLIKDGWIERPILWTTVIAPPGSGKSPALAVARRPLDGLQGDAWTAYQLALADWQRQIAAAKAEKRHDEPPRPTLEHYHTVDATVEALSRILAGSAGVVLVRDEVAGWVKGHDAYRKGGDREAFLSLWAGQPVKVDRRGAEPLFVPRPVLCVTGGIQPDRLPELRGAGGALDGFLDRFLFSWPETRPYLWTEAAPDPADAAAVARLFGKLRATGGEHDGGAGHLLRLAPEAREVFKTWYDDNARHISETHGLEAGFAAKFPGQLARLTLILHSLNCPDDLTGDVPAETVTDAIALVEYFAAHLARVLPAFGASGGPRETGVRGRVARILERAVGDWVDRTTISDCLGSRTPAETITAALQELADAGRAESRTTPTGKRPREEWRRCGTAHRNYGNMENCPLDPLITPYFHSSAMDDEEQPREVWQP